MASRHLTHPQGSSNAAELLAALLPSDRRRVAGALVALAASLLEDEVSSDATSIDLVREGVRRGLWPSVDVGAAHARAGRLVGAAKVGRRWLGPASSLDVFVREHGEAPAGRTATTKAEPVDDLLEATRAAARRG